MADKTICFENVTNFDFDYQLDVNYTYGPYWGPNFIYQYDSNKLYKITGMSGTRSFDVNNATCIHNDCIVDNCKSCSVNINTNCLICEANYYLNISSG